MQKKILSFMQNCPNCSTLQTGAPGQLLTLLLKLLHHKVKSIPALKPSHSSHLKLTQIQTHSFIFLHINFEMVSSVMLSLTGASVKREVKEKSAFANNKTHEVYTKKTPTFVPNVVQNGDSSTFGGNNPNIF